MENLIERDQKAVWHPFAPVRGGYPTLPLSHGKGAWLYTTDGRKVLDGISSWWVNTLGHAHPEIADALYKQAQTLPHVIFAGFTHAPAVDLAERILTLLPHQQRVFFSDNGSTAVEVGLKIAIQYWKNKGETKRRRIIALEGAYHGDTFGAMAVGERGGFNLPWEPYLFEVEFLPFPSSGNEESCLSRFRESVKKGDVAALILEPGVQGAAGMRIYSEDVLDELLGIAAESGTITIADEVFTGFYRTGKMFATDGLKNTPDIMCLSKGLTAGTLPLSLTTVGKRIFDAFDNEDRRLAFYHGHSYTGNPLACAVALKSLEILERQDTKDSIQRICVQQKHFADSLKGHAGVRKVDALGTILSIEIETGEGTGYFNQLRETIYGFFMDREILLRPLGNVIYFLPPYVISENEIKHVHSSISDFLETVILPRLHR